MTDSELNRAQANPRSKNGTRHKIHAAASLRGNNNRLEPHFSDDLLKQFGNDPELNKWIRDNQSNLDKPNTDGTIPFGTDHLQEHERRKFLAAETATNYNHHPEITAESIQ
jgi:hypothetical protein